MVLSAKQKYQFNMKKINCIVCNSKVSEIDISYFSEIYKASVCKYCCQRFPPSELKLMIGLFFAYGGHFGKLKSEGKSLEEVCLVALNHLNSRDIEVRPEEIDIRIYHQLLVYGYSQDDYVNFLNQMTPKEREP